jgi:hypothetical protein
MLGICLGQGHAEGMWVVKTQLQINGVFWDVRALGDLEKDLMIDPEQATLFVRPFVMPLMKALAELPRLSGQPVRVPLIGDVR